jgi:anti-sigma28 factor (negative regulator of flagellin synthesis)
MLEITPYSNHPERTLAEVHRAAAGSRAPAPSTRTAAADPPEDQVELSAAAEQSDQVTAESADRVQALRAQIAEGTYLTPDKIDAAVERLYEELFGRSGANPPPADS